ncbi:N-acetylneuraminate lyase-like isoform X2 [Dreissena polymorpha]|uniref:N-acetylneuraminate lyase-like isoform X2 n=1 Tax=Dreissena polymorpha TaxID=45954 RepID=UPI002264962A|nr:N-acetylneuraminate lyase-like isoform X2 [Dreissena polymorpha]
MTRVVIKSTRKMIAIIIFIAHRFIAQTDGFRLKDMVAAPFTPFTADGEVNYNILDDYADYIVKTNFTGIFVNGTLGEGLSLTLLERKSLAEGWVRASRGRLQIIVHVGATCVRDSQELARHAEEIGATAIAGLSPSYYKPESEEILVETMSLIAGAAPNTPFYYYDINFFTGLYINIRKFMELAKARIPTLRGLKNSSREIPGSYDCTFVEECQVLVGTDVQYLSYLAHGISGVVVASYLGNLFDDMRRAYQTGDTAKALEHQNIAHKINNIRNKHGGGINVAKAMFKILTGLDAGPVRLPLRSLKADEFNAIRGDLVDAGLTDVSLPTDQ